MRSYRLLLVDDDPLILHSFAPLLQSAGYQVQTAADGTEALDIVRNGHPDIMITDLVMGAMDGICLLKEAKTIRPDLMTIVLTGYGDLNSAVEALRCKADDYLQKPCEMDEIRFRVKKCLDKLEMKKKIKAYEQILPVCCVCKKIRDDTGRKPGTGRWFSVETYLWAKAGIVSSSTYCPECSDECNGGFGQ